MMTVRAVMMAVWVGTLWVPTGGEARPLLYRQPALQSIVRAGPDDLVFLGGDGLALDDVVVYSAVAQARASRAPPSSVPRTSSALTGTAQVVGRYGPPYGLNLRLPEQWDERQTYLLWVRSPAGEWSDG